MLNPDRTPAARPTFSAGERGGTERQPKLVPNTGFGRQCGAGGASRLLGSSARVRLPRSRQRRDGGRESQNGRARVGGVSRRGLGRSARPGGRRSAMEPVPHLGDAPAAARGEASAPEGEELRQAPAPEGESLRQASAPG